MDIVAEKAALRIAARRNRSGLDATAAGTLLANNVMRELVLAPRCTVAATWPLPGEIDLRPLMHALHERGHPIVLPETPPRGHALLFRLWRPGAPMLREAFGTWRTAGEPAQPHVMFVPLLAFDRAGGRLGYGGGYYDRTRAAYPDTLAVGAGFASQEVSVVPMDRHDRRLDMVVTERELVLCTSPDTSA